MMKFSVVLIVMSFSTSIASPLTKSGVLSQLTVKAERTELVEQLTATFRSGANKERIAHWEDDLRSVYKALPKNPVGNLGHAAARYALHRSFVKGHGWSLSGLQPTHQTVNDSSPAESMKEWVPEYMLTVIEQLLGTHGISLRELAVLAATFEDLIHKEGHSRLKDVFAHFKLPTDKILDDEEGESSLGMYMIMYTSAHGNVVKTPEIVEEAKLILESETKQWLEDVMFNMTNVNYDLMDFNQMTRIVERVAEQYASFNDKECSGLKEVLLGVEDPYKLGRVKLSEFYKKGLSQGYWNLDEKVEYLRAIGALDESNPKIPRVVIPNYVNSQANCLISSNFYTICCRDECEDMMGQLEAAIGAPTAEVAQIEEIITGLRPGNQPLPADLMRRLKEISEYHDGQVPLHGRLFAQWMHHAFPRECPYPHEGTDDAQAASDWLAEGSSRATKDEMLSYIEPAHKKKESKLKARVLHRKEVSPVEEDEDDKHTELPWTNTETLLVHPGQKQYNAWDTFFAVSETVAYMVLILFLGAAVFVAREAYLSRPSLVNKIEAFKKNKLQEEERSLEHLARAERVRRRHKIEQAAEVMQEEV